MFITTFQNSPTDSTSTLNENTDLLIKNYKELEQNNGYTWDNFNQYSKIGEFKTCEEKDIPECPIIPKENKKLVTDPNIKRPGHIVKHCSLTRQQQKYELEKQKRESEIQFANQKPTVQRVDKNIVSYKTKGVTNIYAPIIKKENVNEDRAMARGVRDAAEIALRNPEIVRPKNQAPFESIEKYNIDE